MIWRGFVEAIAFAWTLLIFTLFVLPIVAIGCSAGWSAAVFKLAYRVGWNSYAQYHQRNQEIVRRMNS